MTHDGMDMTTLEHVSFQTRDSNDDEWTSRRQSGDGSTPQTSERSNHLTRISREEVAMVTLTARLLLSKTLTRPIKILGSDGFNPSEIYRHRLSPNPRPSSHEVFIT